MIDVLELADLPGEQKDSWNTGLDCGQPLPNGSTAISRFEFIDLLNRTLVPDAARSHNLGYSQQ